MMWIWWKSLVPEQRQHWLKISTKQRQNKWFCCLCRWVTCLLCHFSKRMQRDQEKSAMLRLSAPSWYLSNTPVKAALWQSWQLGPPVLQSLPKSLLRRDDKISSQKTLSFGSRIFSDFWENRQQKIRTWGGKRKILSSYQNRESSLLKPSNYYR